MYATSTQKKEWTFTREQIVDKRHYANDAFRTEYKDYIKADEAESYLTPEEELQLKKFVERAAIRFSHSFQPPIWPSIRWTAFTYFKRLYLCWSVMDHAPKNVMMACFYLAMKIDEFYVSVDEFVSNLTTGTAEHNSTKILGYEPEIIRVLNYQLTVHCPYRPFEGHLLEMKTTMLLLNFDLELLRHPSEEFFEMCLLSDAVLMYAPSQIALAAIKYGLKWLDKSPEVLREFLCKLLRVDENSEAANENVLEKLLSRLDEIIEIAKEGQQAISQEQHETLLKRSEACAGLTSVLKRRKLAGTGERKKEEPIDSDDD